LAIWHSRQLAQESELWLHVRRECLAHELSQIFLVGARLEHHGRNHAFTRRRIGHTDRRTFNDSSLSIEHLLDFGGIKANSKGLDHSVRSAEQRQVAVLVDDSRVVRKLHWPPRNCGMT